MLSSMGSDLETPSEGDTKHLQEEKKEKQPKIKPDT